MQNAIENFPKTRSALPPEFQGVYADHYKLNREGASRASGLAKWMESWMHRKVAGDTIQGIERSTLEIGAGTLNHLPYEKESKPYDIVEPFRELFETSPLTKRLRNIYDDISEIGNGIEYDRIVSIASFEHICNLPEVVARCGILLKRSGNLRVGIPSEGTVLWRLGYTFTTGIEFRRKYNLDYDVLMRHEHVNTAREIEDVLRYFFSSVSCRVFGMAKSLSFYQFFSCTDADIKRCSEFIGRSDASTASDQLGGPDKRA